MPNEAKKINLEEFKREREKMDSHTTSVTIEKKHEKFLSENNLNLSKLVRKFLDDLIKEQS